MMNQMNVVLSCDKTKFSRVKLKVGWFSLRQLCSVINSSHFSVVSFYKFNKIEDPPSAVSRVSVALRDLRANGRIYVNRVGVNAQMCLPSENLSCARALF